MSRLKAQFIMRIITAALILSAVGGIQAAARTEPFQIAPTTVNMFIDDDEAVAFDYYHIDGYNYFKLRDLAYTFSSTKKQFSVVWDEDTETVLIATGKPYEPIGIEMVTGGQSKTATPTTTKIIFDGKESTHNTLNIDGYNYFRLRSIMELLDVLTGRIDDDFQIDTTQPFCHLY